MEYDDPISRRGGKLIACENSRPSSPPARVAFRAKRHSGGSEEGRLFSQASKLTFHLCFQLIPGGGGGLLGSLFAGYVPLASQSPYPIIVYSVANYRPHLSHFWANMSFSRSQLSHFIFMYVPFIE